MFGKIAQLFKSALAETPLNGSSSDPQLYYELPFEFNTHWVSLDYPQNNEKTTDIIRKLHHGEPIILKWSDTVFRDRDQVQVFTRRQKQIGWVPGPYPELEYAVKNGCPVDARVKKTGEVQDSDVDIWWAVVEGVIKIPHAPCPTMVYLTSYKHRYHLREDCGQAQKEQLPLELALARGGVPCPHCVGTDKQQNGSNDPQ